jgi:uncharacterized membrane protein
VPGLVPRRATPSHNRHLDPRASVRQRTTPRAVAAARAGEEAAVNRTLTIGLTVLAGAAVIEAALVPGVVIGAAAILAPRYLRSFARRPRPAASAETRHAKAAAMHDPDPSAPGLRSVGLGRFRIGQAVAKTVTFRIIVTTLDFTTNYVVIGELNTAAGLSAFNLVAGPLLYLAHETAWNYFGPPDDGDVAVRIRRAPETNGATTPAGLRISRALAKTVTFRVIASIFDFTVNYVVVRDVATAAGLSAFGFVLGPFVYFGHEKAWDHFTTPRDDMALLPPPARLLPAPA